MTVTERAAEIICQHACEIDGGCEEAAEAMAAADLLVTDLDVAFIQLAHSAEPLLRRHLDRDEDDRRADEWVARYAELHDAYLASRGAT